MRHNAVIQLLSATITSDDDGIQTEVLTPRQIYANEMSVGNSEFYNAAQTGLRAEKKFEVYTFEYQDETRLAFEGVTYRIIRTEGKGEKTRLTCERVSGDG